MKDYLILAIENLTGGAGCMVWNNDYSTVQWVDFKGTPPTQAQIDAEIERIKISEVSEEAHKVAAKAALLERLGITAEEAKLLLG
jgi:hypothetical protein